MTTCNVKESQYGAIRVLEVSDSSVGCGLVAEAIENRIRKGAVEDKRVVLGLATGSTPIPLYEELVRRHSESGLSFSGVETFNLDEYVGLSPDHPESYHHFMRTHLFGRVDLPRGQTHLPLGSTPPAMIVEHCLHYEGLIKQSGGIDIQILGVGRNGHIGFNEPGSAVDSRTRLVELDEVTRTAAAGAFGGIDAVPQYAISMGIGTILDAREIFLFAWGKAKAEAVRTALCEAPSTDCPASFLQNHPQVTMVLDAESASLLETP